ncbi:hypothetical protein WOLCODRAFT_159286 [Wolfiporia cocos MD-104 SS10]|uniref:Uncharacterized protein n=1 Tax=Wolfiporia cocos (strain MD-104) TaxID=742152 RepID=A0A2H3JBY0_WOLCO|nr:hypothetical protein WOLCODRAFT_159286 [Wolfiporia cocos MD-104 SS10]
MPLRGTRDTCAMRIRCGQQCHGELHRDTSPAEGTRGLPLHRDRHTPQPTSKGTSSPRQQHPAHALGPPQGQPTKGTTDRISQDVKAIQRPQGQSDSPTRTLTTSGSIKGHQATQQCTQRKARQPEQPTGCQTKGTPSPRQPAMQQQ